jgi:hypothetical protein
MSVQPIHPGPEKPTVSVVFVTPEIAERWLGMNGHNRLIRGATVRQYARDMTAGDWRLTGETIKFAPDGTLLDGQHRLKAVVLSGVTIPMFVARGIDPEAQNVMDSGRKRTASDMLGLAGEKNYSTLAAAARLALAIKAGQDLSTYDPSHAEIQQYVHDHPDLRRAVEFTKTLTRKTDCPPAMVAYTYYELAKIDMYDAANFWVAVAEKVGLTAGDPVLALSNRLAECRRNRQKVDRATYLSLIYRAWNARRSGQSLRTLRVNSPAGGSVPIPKPR